MTMRIESKAIRNAVNSGIKYYAYIIGAGDGCDYTIGCNISVEALSGNTLEEAYKSLEEHMGYNGVETAFVIEASKVSFFDVERHYEEEAKQEAEAERCSIEASEKAEFERLSAKFGAER